MPLTDALNRNLAAMSQSATHPSQTDQLELAEQLAKNQAAASISDLRFDLSQPITTDQMTHSAADLMGLLFADVDRMLERGVVLGAAEARSAETRSAEESAAASELGRGATLEALLSSPFGAQFSALAPKLSPRDLVPSLEPEIEQPPAAPEEASDPATGSAEKGSAEKGGSAWLVTLCGSLLLSLGLLSFLYRTQVSGMWLALLEKYRPAPVELATGTEPAGSQSASQSGSQSDSQPEYADFLGYLQQSLERLSRHAELPPPSPLPAPDAAASPAPSVIERVYVPVYPSATAPAQPGSTAPAASQPAPRSAQSAQTQPLPSVRPASPASPAVAAVPNIGAETSHTLIGVLELGERSAALFEVNGTPKRIEVGEQVGSSGWTLVSISNQEAIVRRNGEVRSIYVGQKF